MAEEKIRIDIEAQDSASKTLDKVADKAEELEKASPTVDVDADTKAATKSLDQVDAQAKELDQRDVTIALEAKVSDLKGQLAEAEAALDQVREKADQAGKATEDIGGRAERGSVNVVNATRDMTGPLGEASSMVGDFGDSFGAAAETAVAKLGLVGTKAGDLATTILPGIGVAIGAAAAAWSVFRAHQAKAREEAEKLAEANRKIAESLRAGKVEDAAKGMADQYKDLFDRAERAGIGVDQVTERLLGQRAAIPTLNDQIRRYNELAAEQARHNEDAQFATHAHALELEGLRDDIERAASSYEAENGTLDRNAARLQVVSDHLGGLKSATDRAADANDRYKRSLAMESDFQSAVDSADNLTDSLADLNKLQKDSKTSAEDLGDAQRQAGEDATRLKSDIVNLVAEYGRIPASVETDILAQVPPEQQQQWRDFIHDVESEHVAPIKIQIDNRGEVVTVQGFPIKIRQYGGDDIVSRPTVFLAGEHGFPERVRVTPGLADPTGAAPASSAPAQSFTYNIHLPQGTRGDDLLRTMRDHQRRNGGRAAF